MVAGAGWEVVVAYGVDGGGELEVDGKGRRRRGRGRERLSARMAGTVDVALEGAIGVVHLPD